MPTDSPLTDRISPTDDAAASPRALTWRERNIADKAVAKAHKQINRARQLMYRNASISERKQLDPRPGSIVTVAGTAYIVQRNGEYRRYVEPVPTADA